MSKIARALEILTQHPTLNSTQLAEMVPCSPGWASEAVGRFRSSNRRIKSLKVQCHWCGKAYVLVRQKMRTYVQNRRRHPSLRSKCPECVEKTGRTGRTRIPVAA